MDSQGGALLPVAASIRLRASQARYGRNSAPWGGRGACDQKSSDGAFLSLKEACLVCSLTNIQPEMRSQGACQIIHHIQWLYLLFFHTVRGRLATFWKKLS